MHRFRLVSFALLSSLWLLAGCGDSGSGSERDRRRGRMGQLRRRRRRAAPLAPRSDHAGQRRESRSGLDLPPRRRALGFSRRCRSPWHAGLDDVPEYADPGGRHALHLFALQQGDRPGRGDRGGALEVRPGGEPRRAVSAQLPRRERLDGCPRAARRPLLDAHLHGDDRRASDCARCRDWPTLSRLWWRRDRRSHRGTRGGRPRRVRRDVAAGRARRSDRDGIDGAR